MKHCIYADGSEIQMVEGSGQCPLDPEGNPPVDTTFSMEAQATAGDPLWILLAVILGLLGYKTLHSQKGLRKA